MKNKEFTDHLKVEFTGDQVRQKGIELAQVMGEAEHIQTELESQVSGYKSRLKAKAAVIKKLKDQINNGFDYLPVRCEIHYNEPEPGKKTTYRQDTGAAVSITDMTGDEKQIKIEEFEELEQADAPFTVGKEESTDAPAEVEADKSNIDAVVGELTVAEASERYPDQTRSIKEVKPEDAYIVRSDETGTIWHEPTSEKNPDPEIFFDLETTKDDLYYQYVGESLTPDVYLKIVNDVEAYGIFRNDTAALDAERLKLPKGVVKKIVDASKVNILREDHTGTVFTISDLGTIFFDKSRKTDKPIELIQVVSELTESVSEHPKSESKPAKNVSNDKFSTRSADWFADRIGKEVEAKSTDKDRFNGPMNIKDQEHAEYLAAVAQNQQNYTFRDVPTAG